MTIKITLPDGAIKEFASAPTGLDIANDISPGLARNSVAIAVDGEQWDLTRAIEQNASVQIITRNSEEGLEILRHDAAHIMAEAVKELYPETQVTIGPAIENGFYYDFSRKEAFTPDDLEKIEKRMKEIVKRDEKIERLVWERDEAIEYFKGIGEDYKAEIIADLPGDETLTVYKQGEFLDLCRGPHLPSTKVLGDGFKLTKLAGAYWRGDSNNEQLQRIYGTAWADKKQLKQYLRRLEEAEKRDHRKLGRQQNLFHFHEDAPGSVFWHPKGWALFLELLSYMRDRTNQAGYVEVNTPDVMDRALWKVSGHWQNYRENMFTTQTEDERVFALKPMNCPGSVLMFAQGLKSYRDLPLRMAEFGKVHRYEPSGALHGLMRVRHFTQDDAHIYCTEDQMQAECEEVVALVLDIYKDFGFEDIVIKLSTRPEKRIGSDEIWDKLEGALQGALNSMGLDFVLYPGEGAFYGPKLEFVLRDAIGRDWQCGTLQVDMNLPERFDISYVSEDNDKKRPVMLHRALFGSLERFIGILIEQHSGALPLWLAPTQVVLATIVADADGYAEKVAEKLRAQGLRVELDLRNEKISYKVREHSLQKVPVILCLGKREAEESTVAVRRFGSKQQSVVSVDELINVLQQEIAAKQSIAIQKAS